MDADAWNSRYAERDMLWSLEPNRFVEAELADLAPGSALDLACGEGRNALWLAGRGWTVTAVDYSDVAVARGREIGGSRGVEVDWHVADVTRWEPPEGAFDLVVVSYLQLPADERRVVLERAAGAVAPGGTLFVVAHAVRNLTEGAGGPSSAAVLYEVADVTDVLGGGFVVERGEEVERPMETEDGMAAAIDVLVRARRTR